jgi:hypothetical protein
MVNFRCTRVNLNENVVYIKVNSAPRKINQDSISRILVKKALAVPVVRTFDGNA